VINLLLLFIFLTVEITRNIIHVITSVSDLHFSKYGQRKYRLGYCSGLKTDTPLLVIVRQESICGFSVHIIQGLQGNRLRIKFEDKCSTELSVVDVLATVSLGIFSDSDPHLLYYDLIW
jgi:hypothetical protein